MKHYKDDSGVEHIDIKQTLSGGFGGTDEERTLDWTNREKNDRVFGDVIAKSRRVKLDEIDNEFLKNGFTDDVAEHGAIQSYVESDTPKSVTSWIADQVCTTPLYFILLTYLCMSVDLGFRGGW